MAPAVRKHPGARPEPHGGPDMTDGTSTLGVTPTSAVDAVATFLADTDAVSEQSFERLVELMERFAVFATTGHGLADLRACSRGLVDGFVTAPTSQGEAPSATVMHLRRCAVRMLFRVARQLGFVDVDPTMDLGLPARRPSAARPLTDVEVDVCRAASMYRFDGTRLPAAWALAEAGVRSGELAKITVGDLDPDGTGLWSPGCRSALPRHVDLTGWGVAQVRRRVTRLDGDPDRPLVYEGDGSDKSRQAASCIAVSVTLTRAGLGDDPAVRPVSVTGWAGRKVMEATGRVDLVATALGMRSLDRAARLIGLEPSPARVG